MHVDVVDPGAAIFPGLATVAAQQNPAMLEQDKKQILIVRVNEDMAHVGLFDTAQSRRHIPFLFYLVGKIEHAVQWLPLGAAVLAAEQANRTDAHVDDAFVVRVNGESANVPFHDLLPCLAAILRPITAVEGHRRKHNLRLVAAADQVLQRFTLEELAGGAHRSALRLDDLQATIMRNVIA
jgi:hypothetical protein